jgi:hypothetical protein
MLNSVECKQHIVVYSDQYGVNIIIVDFRMGIIPNIAALILQYNVTSLLRIQTSLANKQNL